MADEVIECEELRLPRRSQIVFEHAPNATMIARKNYLWNWTMKSDDSPFM